MSETAEVLVCGAGGDALVSVPEIKAQINAIQALMKGAMIGPTRDNPNGVHYGIIPGCGDKPTLLKPGAEKISMMFRLVPEYDIRQTDLAHGHREYRIICTLKSAKSGVFCGQGVGAASTMESKFRFRWENTEQAVPKEYWDHRDKDLLGGETYAPRKVRDADGKQSWVIFQRIEHDNPADYYNTVLKMGKKRAHVDAVLTATAASDIFTQDIEDMQPEGGDGKRAEPARPPVSMPTPTTPAQRSDDNPVSGVIETVSQKSGTGKKGAWTKYGIKIGNEWFGTFDHKLGEKATGLQGKEVTLTWEQDGQFKTATGIVPAGENGTSPETEDPLPL
jgi:hypothetical protein